MTTARLSPTSPDTDTQTLEAEPIWSAALAWVDALYTDAVDHKDATGFAAAFTEDAEMRFGNAPPVVGREAIRAAIAQFFASFATLRHESTGVWCQGDAVIVAANVTYLRHDARTVTVPAVTIFRIVGALGPPFVAHRCQMYVDLAPLFAPAAPGDAP